MMVGSTVDLKIDRPVVEKHTDRLQIIKLNCLSNEGVKALSDVDFTLRSGEILGVAGIAGSGQKELCEAIAGLYHVSSGAILYHPDESETINIVGKTPKEIKQMGIKFAFVPEDRLGMGLVANMDMTDNVMLRYYNDGTGPFVDRKSPKKLAESLIEQLKIVTPGVTTPVRRLSGGNVQKVLLGREIASGPRVLIVAYPVRGLDINSSYTIYGLLNEQKMQGVAVLFVGEDLDVLLELADRILVLCGGQISGIVDAKTTTKEQVGLLMTSIQNTPRADEEVTGHG